MRPIIQLTAGLLLFAGVLAHAQISSFQHVIFIVQENRTPDNLFYGLCTLPTLCSTNPTGSQYNIQTNNWLDNSSRTGHTQPRPVDLAGGYTNGHANGAWVKQCDLNATTGVCQMDGASDTGCSGDCPTQAQFRYVSDSTGTIDPYLQLATQYGWANYMFQTNQGPSFPAHQFLFGGTSAPSAADDVAGLFVSGNVYNTDESTAAGCIAVAGALVKEVAPPGVNTEDIYPCFEHNTIVDILPSNVSWTYYTSAGGGSIWTAPNAINHICQPDKPTGGQCVGPEWTNNVVTKLSQVLDDIGECALNNLIWVIPSGANSDHGSRNDGGGPSWVASIVNAVGQSTCANADGSTYWDSTAILITWDDWGGWYDHEPPTILSGVQGSYQYGFRVPLIVVSAYTRAGFIDNARHDFGSMLRFVEGNFGIQEGVLNFADARASDDLAAFFDLKSTPRPFVTIPSAKTADFFLHDTRPPTDPDDY